MVLYGRRRVGKTELIRQFCKGRRHLFWTADQSPDRELLGDFSRRVWAVATEEAPPGFTFPSWEAAFRHLATLARDEPLVVVIDEFTYLIDANAAVPSILQKVWDDALSGTKVQLVLCGSFPGMMEREVLGYQSALYGRRSGQYLVEPLTFRDAGAFFPGKDGVWRVEAHAVLGGMPAYLRQFEGESDVLEGVGARILRKGTFLYDEPRFLLMQEVREPAKYFSLLRAIAGGKTRPNEIAQSSGLADRTAVVRYLDTLRDMGLVERRLPVTETEPHKSRKGSYRMRDPFIRFWFRFVFPHRTELESGFREDVLERRVRPYFADFVGPVFEDVAREQLLAGALSLPFVPARIGSWWDGETEIDLVALDESGNDVLVGECKWWSGPVGQNVLRELQRKAWAMARRHPEQIRPDARVHSILFSRAGFTPELIREAASRDVTLVEAGTLG